MSQFKIGQKTRILKTISEQEVLQFADIVKDYNPVHIDKDFSKKSIFGRRIVHGMFVASLISTVLGSKLPGPGAIYLGQTLQFLEPVFIGDTITAKVKVIKIRNDKPIITLETSCYNQNEDLVLVGEAVLKA